MKALFISNSPFVLSFMIFEGHMSENPSDYSHRAGLIYNENYLSEKFLSK